MRTIDATDKTSPTDRIRMILVGLLGLASLVCGTILYSQGGSFARWSEFQSIPETINEHAALFVIGGIGVFCAGALGTIAVAQLMVLGKRLDRLSPVQPTAPAKLSLSPTDRRYLRRLGILAWVAGALSVSALLGGGLVMYLVTERQSQAFRSAASAAEIRQLMANMVAGLGLAAIPVFLALAFLVLSLLARLAQQTRLASLGTESGT